MSVPADTSVALELPPPFFAVSARNTSQGTKLVGRNCVCYGFFGKDEPTSGTSIIRFFDGQDANGTLVFEMSLAQAESKWVTFPLNGLRIQTGIFVQAAAGPVSFGAWVYYK